MEIPDKVEKAKLTLQLLHRDLNQRAQLFLECFFSVVGISIFRLCKNSIKACRGTLIVDLELDLLRKSIAHFIENFAHKRYSP